MNKNKVLIIAEAGVNHNGSLDVAKKMVDSAVNAGVDIVKFQTFKTEKVVLQSVNLAEYQRKNINTIDTTQYSMLKKLELSYDDQYELANYCKEKKIKFLSTAFDNDSIEFLSRLNIGLWKIPSGEITNYLYLKKIALFKQPILLSTGMSELHEIEAAISVLLKFGLEKKQITLLHCNSGYPTPMIDVNLRAMHTIANKFKVSIGYSDHTKGIEIPIAAVACGAKVIEKHFTLNKNMKGPDHKTSLNPVELKKMVKSIRNVEIALGSKSKFVTQSELENIKYARKSIIAIKAISKGEVFTEDNISVKRPGSGISPMYWENIIGKESPRNYSPNDFIELL